MTLKRIWLIVFLVSFGWGFAQPTEKSVNELLSKAGNAFYQLDGVESLKLSKRALDQAKALKNEALMAKAYNLIGLNFDEFYDPVKGLRYYLRGLKYAEKAKNDTVQIWLCNNIGNFYSYRKNDLKNSIEYYKRGLYYADKIKDSSEIMYAKLSIAGAYFGANKYRQGEVYMRSISNFILKKKRY